MWNFIEKVAGGTGGAGGALAPPVFWEKDTKITLKFALSEAAIQLPKMNVGRFAISQSKRAFFKRAWQILKVLSRP